MSEIKFACPVCGQHIRCDSAKSGSQMECPTCFRKLVVPQASAAEDSKLILTAAAVSSRPVPSLAPADVMAARPARDRSTLIFVIALLAFAGLAAGTVYAFRDKLFKPREQNRIAQTNAPGPTDLNAPAPFAPAPAWSETNWTLNLAERSFPESVAAGRVNARSFTLERATVQAGTLTFRHQSRTEEEMSVTINLFAKQGEELAGQNVNVDASWTNAPKVTLRWKDEQQQPLSHTYRKGYALKMQFGAVTNGILPGQVYLCVPDDQKSCLAGVFEAEIRKPAAPKPPKTSKPKSPPPKR